MRGQAKRLGRLQGPQILACLPFVIALAACAGGEHDPESAQVARLAGQGFVIVTDGRGGAGPSALRYKGPPAKVIACRSGGGSFQPTDQAGESATADERFVVRQRGEVAAYVIVEDNGALRGLYVNDVVRSVVAQDGRVAARELVRIDFPPTGTGQFRNGLACRART